jgi:hypothetical protein
MADEKQAQSKAGPKLRKTWRVVATQQGQYNQVLIEPGTVFDLLLYADGTYPLAVRFEAKKDEAGKVIEDEWDQIPLTMKDGTFLHRDFAEDMGAKLVRRGPKAGETVHLGWMRLVPVQTPIGLYLPATDFWSGRPIPGPAVNQLTGEQFMPWFSGGDRGPMDRKRNHAPILDVLPRPVEDSLA